EPGAAVGAAAGVVDPVEAFEDPLHVVGRDADPVVGDGDLDVVVVGGRDPVSGDDHPGAGVGVDHGVLDQIAHRDAELAGAAEHPAVPFSGDGQVDLVLFGIDPAAVDRVGQHLVDVNL